MNTQKFLESFLSVSTRKTKHQFIEQLLVVNSVAASEDETDQRVLTTPYPNSRPLGTERNAAASFDIQKGIR